MSQLRPTVLIAVPSNTAQAPTKPAVLVATTAVSARLRPADDIGNAASIMDSPSHGQ
jgi:hypothetical protein